MWQDLQKHFKLQFYNSVLVTVLSAFFDFLQILKYDFFVVVLECVDLNSILFIAGSS